MRIFDFSDYKKYLKARNGSLPSNGRGELTRIANHLGIHTTMVTHVLRGDAHLSIEQSLKLADYLALNDIETDFLVALVQWQRAGDKRTAEYCRKKLEDIRSRALDLRQRLGTKNELSEADRAFYYSNWRYSFLRLLTAIDKYQSETALAAESRLSLGKVREALDFLISRGLCVEAGGRVKYGEVPTYVEASSPLVTRHHSNWRAKAQERFDSLRTEDLLFTYPVVMAEDDFLKIREELVRFIDGFRKTANASASENLYCLNVDWLRMSANGSS